MTENIIDTSSTSVNHYIAESVKRNWELTAFSDMGGVNYQYKEVAVVVAKLHILFEEAGLKKGDRIAICGKNSSNWGVCFIACITGGYVAVPILHEFKPDTIHHLVNHSQAKLLFADVAIWENLDEKSMPELEGAIYLAENGIAFTRKEKLREARENLNELFGKKYPRDFTKQDVEYYPDKPDQLALINYTAGSTGMSKGVMLPYSAILGNIVYCIENLKFLLPGDGVVNMLPLAHLYGMIIDMLHVFCKGCHCYFLTRQPSPKVILSAFAKVKPKLIITVPLILEKIIRKRVFPLLEKPMVKVMLKVPILDERLLHKIKDGLINAFGGQVKEIIIGGAPLNGEIEAFLRKINFPYTVGYGMTECGPLISYAPWDKNKLHSVGKILDTYEWKIDSDDPENKPGNLWVKGPNVMQGYFRNPEATKEVMPDGDGWMNTGDLCRIDSDGYLYVSGRSKTMILGPSGQNIYPEEIEQKLNNMPFVMESLVIDDNGRLKALIYPDLENATAQGLDAAAIDKQMEQNIQDLNKEIPPYSKVAGYKILNEEFEKTPKRSIKRFLYQP